uniref:Annexin n=1 Tax=Oryctolagus cuniculus TaxID=9986 RepID=A0A5F9CV44_RABIT
MGESWAGAECGEAHECSFFFTVVSAAEPKTMAKPAQGAKYRGSVHDFPDFDPSQDAEALYTAMKGIGSDKEAILELITSRSNRQRQEVCQSYKSLYGKDLIADLKYELTGKFERLIVGLMRPLAYCDAKEIKDAVSGIGTDEKCLIEILASRTNEQIHQLVAAYKDAYERDLEADIIGDTSGHFQKMLVVLLQGTREEDDVVSEDLVQQDVQDLYEAGELKWGTDEAQFIYILGNRSKQHLRLVFDEYLKTTGKPIEASIRGELSGDFEKLMLAVVKCVRSTPEYFAERLFKAMKGLGTRDNTLIRIMVTRSELDMLDIREIFRTKYEKSLYSMIKNDTSGEYKKALLKLCGGDDDAAGQFFPEAAQVAYQMWELSAVARVELKGTVRPAGDFNPDADAKALRKAMKGIGTDEDTIIDIITHRSNAQRQQIRQTFKSHFGRDLMADLKSEISGDLARLILGLMMPPAHYDAKQLKKAMEGAGTDEKALIEILATRTNAEIHAINEAYKEDYHKSLEDALSSDTSGHFRRILISLATGNREEGGEDRDQAREDAQGAAGLQQAGVAVGKVPEVGPLGTAEKKVKMLEQQRTELLEVNKQWDQHFRSMKQQYEQKITELRQKLADLQKQVTDLEAEREQKQRDFDRKLLLAKSKIEMEETDKEQLTAEAKELRQKVKYLQDQLSPLSRQREYQEKEIQRLNKALEEALSIQGSPSSSPTAFGSPEGATGLLRKQELVTQNELLKQQVKIFEEDFQRERSDRERMNEEKEELKKQVEKLQAQVTMSNAQASGERYHVEPHPEHLCGAYPYAYPPMPARVPHHGFDDWSQIRYPPPPMAMEQPPPLPSSRLFHLPEYTWFSPCGALRNQSSQVMDSPTARPAEQGSTKNDREGPQ